MSEESTEKTVSETVIGSDAVSGDAGSANTDVEQNKTMAIVGYILPILFFVPLLSEHKSPFGMFHANQQLVLLLSALIVNLTGTLIPIIGWFIILPFGSLAVFVIAVLGLLGAAKGEVKPLPFIGGISILK